MSYETGKELFDKLNSLPVRESRTTWAQMEQKAVASIGGFLREVKEVTGKALDFDDMHLSTNGEGDAIMTIGLKDRVPLTAEGVWAQIVEAQRDLAAFIKERKKLEIKIDKLIRLHSALLTVEESKKEATE